MDTNNNSLHDINNRLLTLLKAKDDKLKEFESIMESSFDGILVTDNQGNVLMVNKAYERLTGIKNEDMLGKNMKDLLNPDYMRNSVALMVLEQKTAITIPHQTRNGRSVTVTGNPVFDENGEVWRVVTNVRDITELYELRQELLKAQALEKVYSQLESERIKGKKQNYIAISQEMKEIFFLALKVSSVDTTVLITGESGVGKDVIAQYIHDNSPRSGQPFITINCGAIPESLLESELFGYAPGAFTGASRTGKTGLFELAEGGTLFLDEIGDLPLNLQVKVLRAIETREILPVGGTKTKPSNVRILAATNRDLEKMVSQKLFRADLYYRLNVVQINIPTLRERPDDILPLSVYYLNHFNSLYHQKKRFTSEVTKELEKHLWLGNIRELKNTIERMVVLSNDEFIQISDLPWFATGSSKQYKESVNVNGIVPLKTAVEEVEKKLLENALQKYSTTREIANALGVNQSTIVRKINKYGLK